MGQEKSVQNDHGHGLAKDDTHCDNLISLVVLEQDGDAGERWLAQEPQGAAFGEGDVELPLERAPLHRDDLVESTAQGQRQAKS